MKLIHDTEFAFDDALALRDVLLDGDAIAGHIAGLLNIHTPARNGNRLIVDRCSVRRVKYRMGESLRVLYDIELNGVAQVISTRMFPVGVSLPAGQRAIVDAKLNALWWLFPSDRKLRRLDQLFTPWVIKSLPAELHEWTASDLVEYRPEHSVTVRCLDRRNQTVAYAKRFHEGEVDVNALALRYNTIAEAFAREDNLCMPRALWWSTEEQLLVLEAMPGQTWNDLPSAMLPASMHALGRAIASLHSCTSLSLLSPSDGPAMNSYASRRTDDDVDARAFGSYGSSQELPRFTRLEPDRVVHCTELIAIARPDVRTHCVTLANLLAAGPLATGDRAAARDHDVLLHGDVHPKNALFDDRGVNGVHLSLIDLDQGAFGAAALDVGSLIAVLIHARVLGRLSALDADQAIDSFLEGYGAVRTPPPASTLRWYVSAALVGERAMRAINRVHVPSLRCLDVLLCEAIRIFDEAISHREYS